MPPRTRPLPTGSHWRSRGRGAPGEMDSQSRDRQLGNFWGALVSLQGQGALAWQVTPSMSSSTKCRTTRGSLDQTRSDVACRPGWAQCARRQGKVAPSSGTQAGQGAGWQGWPWLSLFSATGRHPCTGAQVGPAGSNWPKQPTHTVRPQAPPAPRGVTVSWADLGFSLWERDRAISTRRLPWSGGGPGGRDVSANRSSGPRPSTCLRLPSSCPSPAAPTPAPPRSTQGAP